MAVPGGRAFLNPTLSKITLSGFLRQVDGELCWQNYTPERLNLSELSLEHGALTLPFTEVNIYWIYWPLQQLPAQGAPKFLQQGLQEQNLPRFHWFLSPFQLPDYNVVMMAQPQTNCLFIQREMIFVNLYSLSIRQGINPLSLPGSKELPEMQG